MTISDWYKADTMLLCCERARLAERLRVERFATSAVSGAVFDLSRTILIRMTEAVL